MFSNKMDFSSCAIWIDFYKLDYLVTHKYATWVHVILREASFPVGLVAACRWPIIIATVIILQNC